IFPGESTSICNADGSWRSRHRPARAAARVRVKHPRHSGEPPANGCRSWSGGWRLSNNGRGSCTTSSRRPRPSRNASHDWMPSSRRYSPRRTRSSRSGWRLRNWWSSGPPDRVAPAVSRFAGSWPIFLRRLTRMSSFVDRMVQSATGVAGARCGMVTGVPDDPTRRSWAVVHQRARRVAGALSETPVPPGSAVAILAVEPELVAAGAQGVWLAGGSVTMLHQPTARTDLTEWAVDTVRVLELIDATVVLLGESFGQLAPTLREHGIRYRMFAELLSADPIAAPLERDAEDTALLQLTSGSTAEPKAVRITHGNLMSSATAMARRIELDTAPDTPGDVMVSWLPTFHD